jgi:glyoxylase-like metal-dependent hydrolase (beta-lactamase superfamily II)
MFEVIDLNFQGEREVIASYVLRGPAGVALVEVGPGSTADTLIAGLHALGIEPADVTDILLTHIHLDHAGAAGRLAQESDATVHVHRVGAPHLIDPSKLLASAGRIYGDMMDVLWGETLAVPAGQVHALDDGDDVEAAGLRLRAVDTPGHAYHHMAYLLDGLCFTGDVAAARLPGQRHVRVPTPPPEINLPAWHASLARLRDLRPDRLLLTHYGPLPAGEDALAHLESVGERLDAYAEFVRRRWEAGEDEATMIAAFADWVAAEAQAQGADASAQARYELNVPSLMEVQGLVRYWRKATRTARRP